MHRANHTKAATVDAPIQQVVVFGASGDLAKRKIYPALHTLFTKRSISDATRVVGYGRSKLEHTEFIKHVSSHVKAPVNDGFIDRCTYVNGCYDDFSDLQQYLDDDDQGEKNRLFYLSLPPSSYFTVVEKLPQLYSSTGWNRVVMEKPFGHDLESFLQLKQHVERYVPRESLYLMDHYLGKPALEYLRESGGILGQRLPKSIEVCFSENIGAEGRQYFDESGIIRDVVQNHILQIIAVLLDPQNKLRVLKELSRCSMDSTLIGQYKDYPFQHSNTPTYVDTLCSWRGIPVKIKAGKALANSSVDIYLEYEDASQNVRINVQPHGAVMGQDQSRLLDFVSSEEAYEVMIRDVFDGNRMRYMDMAEIEESWKIVQDIIKVEAPLFAYNKNELSLSK